MKKLFLIPLMTLLCTVMAWANVAKIGETEYATLEEAVNAATAGQTVELIADVTSATYGDNVVNITKSITLDGKGFKIVNAFKKANIKMGGTENHWTTIAINYGGSASAGLDVTIKNISLGNTNTSARYYGILAFDGVSKLTLDKIHAECADYSAQQPICFTGTDATPIVLTVKDSYINAGKSAYPFYVLKPITATITNTTFEGWCSLYFKYRNTAVYGSVVGARGSSVVAENCAFITMNVHHGSTNGFAVFPIEDDGITLDLRNCSMNAERFTETHQSLISLQYKTRTDGFQKVSVSISGDNTYIFNVDLNTLALTGWNSDDDDHPTTYVPKINVPFEFNISGGTFTVDPRAIAYHTYVDGTTFNVEHPTIVTGYEVKEITTQQAGQETTLYRVRKTIENNIGLNENGGDHENTEIKVENTEVTLENTETTAKYVEVSGTSTVTIPEGKSLEVTNGLDVSGNAQVIVKAGSTVVVGEGGVIAESAENIVLEASDNASVAFVMSPEVIVNTTPLATFKFKSRARKIEDGNYVWQRFGIPTFDGKTVVKWDATYNTAIYSFDYNANDWKQEYIGGPGENGIILDGSVFQCYDMTIDKNAESDVEYTFTGNLMGNINAPLNFVKGWNYYANSYTAPIDLESFIKDVESAFEGNVSATVYIHRLSDNKWDAVNKSNFIMNNAAQKEIRPMQAFIMNLREGDSSNENINYAADVYDPVMAKLNPGSGVAKRDQAVEVNYNGVIIKVSKGSESDEVTLLEGEDLSDEFDNGYDADKYDNGVSFSLYCELGEAKLSTFATNDLTDKFIAFDAKEAGEYTLSFSNVIGEPIVLFDEVVEKFITMTAGETYKFTAEAGNDSQRFRIKPSDAPSAVDNTETEVKTTKFVGKDGQIYIRRAGHVYNVQGQNIK